MGTGSRSPRNGVRLRWIPLVWMWESLFLGIFINVSSSWLLAKNLDIGESPL